jgi:hypothetical protein
LENSFSKIFFLASDIGACEVESNDFVLRLLVVLVSLFRESSCQVILSGSGSYRGLEDRE